MKKRSTRVAARAIPAKKATMKAPEKKPGAKRRPARAAAARVSVTRSEAMKKIWAKRKRTAKRARG